MARRRFQSGSLKDDGDRWILRWREDVVDPNGNVKRVRKWDCSVALHFMFYNYCRVHKTLRVTPAMEAGLSDHVWSMEELAGLLESASNQTAA